MPELHSTATKQQSGNIVTKASPDQDPGQETEENNNLETPGNQHYRQQKRNDELFKGSLEDCEEMSSQSSSLRVGLIAQRGTYVAHRIDSLSRVSSTPTKDTKQQNNVQYPEKCS